MNDELQELRAQLTETREALEVLASGQVDSIASTGGPMLLRDAQAALRRSEANFRALIEQLPNQVCVHRKGVVVYANHNAVRALGLGHGDELVAHRLAEFVFPEDEAGLRERFSVAPELGRMISRGQIRLRHRSGRPVMVEVNAQGVTFDNRLATLEVGRDLTEQRKLEAHLLVTDRMASIGMLAAGVAHEINNPLTFVIANLDYVQQQLTALAAREGEGKRYEDSRAALADAQTGAERVKRIVQDLKAFSRTDETPKGPVDVHRMLDVTLTMAMTEIRHRARFVKDYSPDPLFVEGNDSRLSQVMLNLLVNAAQSIAEGATSHNEVRLRTRRGRDGWVELEVRDSGQGMSAETRALLFTPFFTTKPQGVGTGLGLSICHQIITELGGRIEVRSELGKGSTFTVSLPPASEGPSLPAPSVPSPPGRRGRVLVIDDEPMVREVIQRMVGAKHEALVAQSGAEALEIIAREPPFDVIFCDLMMPEMSGAEVHAAIAARDPALARRMVFITGGVFTENARAFLARTPNLTLEKPFASKALLQVVEQALESRGSAGAAPSK